MPNPLTDRCPLLVSQMTLEPYKLTLANETTIDLRSMAERARRHGVAVLWPFELRDLDVKCQETVPGLSQASDWHEAPDALVRAMPVAVMDPALEHAGRQKAQSGPYDTEVCSRSLRINCKDLPCACPDPFFGS